MWTLLLKQYIYRIVPFMLYKCVMIKEEGSVNSSMYL